MKVPFWLRTSTAVTCLSLAVLALGAEPAPNLGSFHHAALVQQTEFGVTFVRSACWEGDGLSQRGSLFGEQCPPERSESATNARPSRLSALCQQPVRFAPSAKPSALSTPPPRGPVVPAVPGTLTLPGGSTLAALLQRYGAADSQSLVFWPARATEHWAILSDPVLLSPGGEWRGPALGDVDGDGRDDVAFVASGVGTCGGATPPDCPYRWLELRLSSGVDLAAGDDCVLLTLGGRRLFEWLVGDLYGDWHTTITPGRVTVLYRGSMGSYTWSVALKGDRYVVQNPIR